MSNTNFRFKQFTIEQDRCAMKVGTDGVLLGAWASIPERGNVLDIGTGTGLIALMVAQRSEASVMGIDISEEACQQAAENVGNSPWKARVEIKFQDVKAMQEAYWGTFDSIVSNPPFFQEKVKCPETLRNTARHTDTLDFSELAACASRLLNDAGTFSVVLPADVAADFIGEALGQRLYLCRQTWVHTKPSAPPKRVLMTFSKKQEMSTEITHLVIHGDKHSFSEDYIALTKDFYLDR